ncbi:MAG: hypothetical protein JSU81_05175 [Candidatus Coatesbacteria bacterium]|nr:MAG: hypothetical protein JSU81_05175 [Candidatus Coatesbacteria bacterium]
MPPGSPPELELPAAEIALGVLGAYNRAYWPAALFGAGLALAALALVLVKPGLFSDVVAKLVLDLLWLWTGVLFFIDRLGPEFNVAYLFGLAFIFQGTFLIVDVFYGTLEFRPSRNAGKVVASLMLFAVVGGLHPVLSTTFGRGWPELRLVGTAPGATAAFTLVMLTFTLHKPRPLFFFLPAAWALAAGIRLAQAWGLYEDLVWAGVAAAVILWFAAEAIRARPRRVVAAEGAAP